MKEGYTERIMGRLREEGLKVTPQRIAVLRYMDGNRSHPSVEEIHREVSTVFPTISLATVYNTLDTLEKIGEVQAVTIDPSRKHYDPDTRPHHHLMCTDCHKIADVFADYVSLLRVPEGLASQFRVAGATVHFLGVCRDCSEK
ncbi:MAG: Fur family transcriptional regulator [Deferrisomatales bacterium]|nr:Fur family transcriptional regulator [Deferrisomatales bacterium]